MILLHELNASQYAKDILKHLAQLNIERGSEVLAADLSTSVERYDFAIQISKKASYEKRFYNKYNYPIIDTPEIINGLSMPSKEIILAITRAAGALIIEAAIKCPAIPGIVLSSIRT